MRSIKKTSLKKNSQKKKSLKKTDAKLCSTCTIVKKNKNNHLYSLNNENWKMFPENIPILGRKHGSQKQLIDVGKEYGGCLLYYFASKQKHTNKLTEFPKSYKDSQNNGLVKLDMSGCAYIHLDCPQPYKEDNISYVSHIHFLISDKSMTHWRPKLGTQSIVCDITKQQIKNHIKNNDRLIINALPKKNYNIKHIPTSFNLFYKEAQKMSSSTIKSKIKEMIKNHTKLQAYLKKNKLSLEDTPIVVYCYDSKCNAGLQLANELINCGFTNILDYKNGILGWMSRK